MKLAEERHQVPQRSAEAVDGPGGDQVEVAPGDAQAELVEAGPLIAALGAADAVIRKDRRDLLPVARRDSFELAALVIGGLHRSRDAEGKRGALGGHVRTLNCRFHIYLDLDASALRQLLLQRDLWVELQKIIEENTCHG